MRKAVNALDVKAVLWDMDGVLIDSERLLCEIFVDVMNEKGWMEDPYGVYLSSIGLNRVAVEALYEEYMSPALAREAFDVVSDRYRERMYTDLKMKPGVRSALQAVADLGLPQMVVTSSHSDTVRRKLNQFELMPFFSHLICGDMVASGKPHPEPYLKACAHLSVLPEETLVIEDSPNGVLSALSAGSNVLHVPDMIDTDPAWQDQILDVLASLDAFPAWFESLRVPA